MIYNADTMEGQALTATLGRMCAAARTAPKTRGIDNIFTLVLTEKDKDALADKMDEAVARALPLQLPSFTRDAQNLRASQAVVLIGVKRAYAGLPYCSFCGFESCKACKDAGARCAFAMIDLGIAASSAVAAAAGDRVDNRIMFSIGKVAEEMEYADSDMLYLGIPVSITGKSIFFDRK